MNFAALNKEQKQLVILIGLVCAIVFFAIIQFVVGPLLGRARAAAEALDHHTDQLAKAERILRAEPRLTAERTQLAAEMGRAAGEFIVPPENPLSWVSEQVYRHARAVGVEVESVSGASSGMPWAAPAEKDKKTSRAFAPYRVQIAAACGYLELVRLFKAFERSNPYLCITDIAIEGQDGGPKPGKHRVTFAIEWPSWSEPQTLKALTASGKTFERSGDSEKKK